MAAVVQADPFTAATTRLRPVVAAVVVAITLAALGAGFGAVLGWLGAPDLPDDAAAIAIVAPAVPVAADGTAANVVVAGRLVELFGYEHPDGPWTWLVGDSDYIGGAVWLTTPGGDDPATTVRTIGDTLAAEGWRVTAGGDVSARKGAWTLGVYEWSDGSVVLALGRARPGRVVPLALLGYVAGLAAGWLGGRRFAGGPTPARVAGWAGVALLLPGTALTTVALIPPQPDALWGSYMLLGIRALSTAGIALLAGAVALAAATRVRRKVRRAWGRP
ncbi:hypothetical protein [Dactylosporangium sp. NPDC049140]|uniref:hypothetical protein n=1 Tax=Dactylosporangium sp. NPDC049140 TaxID=3155647 RepID=UPI003407205E